MKISYNKYLALALAAVACGGFTACNDQLEVLPLEYKEDPNFAPPHISDSWQLEEIASDMVGSGAYAYKDKLYNNLFTRNEGWNGGDGVLTVGLPGGHVLWTFNDSFYGVLSDPEKRVRGNCSFPRNSIMVQKAEKGVAKDEDLIWMADWANPTNPAAGGWKALTHVDHPNAKSYNGDGIAQDYLYWSGDGTIVNGKLQQIWMGVHTPGDGQMLNQNAALAIYSLEGQPGDPGYMKMESIDHNWIPENPYGYGSTLLECEDGHLYLYSSVGTGAFMMNVPIVARTKGKDLTTGVEYYVPNDEGEMIWQDEYPLKVQAQNSGIAPDQGTMTLPWVFKKGDWYYMLAQSFPFGRELHILRAEKPWGPFKDKKLLLKFPTKLDDLQLDDYNHLYMLNHHPALARDGEIVISTNTDCANFWDNFNSPGSADWYRPFFYRIFKWERVFEE